MCSKKETIAHYVHWSKLKEKELLGNQQTHNTVTSSGKVTWQAAIHAVQQEGNSEGGKTTNTQQSLLLALTMNGVARKHWHMIASDTVQSNLASTSGETSYILTGSITRQAWREGVLP